MRAILLNLLAIVLTAGCGVLIVRGFSHEPHLREMVLAAGAVLIAVEVAVVPLMLSRGASQADVSQSGLVSTVVHMFFAGALAGAVKMLLGPSKEFLYWLLAFYWMTLITLCIEIILAIRKAPTIKPRTLVAEKVKTGKQNPK